MTDLPRRFDERLRVLALTPGSAGVAVSGGPDSLALLDLLADASVRYGLALTVLHFDHGIGLKSDEVAAGVGARAQSYGLPWLIGRAELGPEASETEARRARYDWLRERVRGLGLRWLFLGHQRDDQVETILMRALNGSGPAGLAGMAARRGRLIRPLLEFTAAELLTYLEGRGIEPVLDPANSDVRHLRSWLRSEVLPPLRRRLPVDANLQRLSRHAASNRRAWSQFLRGQPELDFRLEPGGVSVAAPPLSGYDSDLAQSVIQSLGRAAGMTVGYRRAAQIRALVVGGASGRRMEWAHGCAEIAFGRLLLIGARLVSAPEPASLMGSSGRLRWGPWELSWDPSPVPDRFDRADWVSWFPPGPYQIRAWQAGARISPLGGTGRRLVVRCFQDRKVPVRQRSDWPMIVAHDRVLWVPGVCRSGDDVPAGGQTGLRIVVRRA